MVHEEIFTLMHHSNGFIHSDVYSMPIHLRRFYIDQLITLKQEENKAAEDANKKARTR